MKFIKFYKKLTDFNRSLYITRNNVSNIIIYHNCLEILSKHFINCLKNEIIKENDYYFIRIIISK
jgi:hypothetical protein